MRHLTRQAPMLTVKVNPINRSDDPVLRRQPSTSCKHRGEVSSHCAFMLQLISEPDTLWAVEREDEVLTCLQALASIHKMYRIPGRSELDGRFSQRRRYEKMYFDDDASLATAIARSGGSGTGPYTSWFPANRASEKMGAGSRSSTDLDRRHARETRGKPDAQRKVIDLR